MCDLAGNQVTKRRHRRIPLKAGPERGHENVRHQEGQESTI